MYPCVCVLIKSTGRVYLIGVYPIEVLVYLMVKDATIVPGFPSVLLVHTCTYTSTSPLCTDKIGPSSINYRTFMH